MMIDSVEEMVGKTPLLRLHRLEKELGLKAQLYAKLECLNPTGSAKDRAAVEILNDAEKKGLLKPGGVVLEATSGNTGIGLASVCAARGYKAIIIMPDTMSKERIRLMQAYGAQVVLSDGSKGMAGSLEKVAEVKQKYPEAFEAGQFVNPANAQAHYKTTGPEIWQDLGEKVDLFIAGIGTGGTITGTARYLKEKKPQVEIIGIEPASSPLITEGHAGSHGLQGIGANFIPEVLDLSLVDRVVTATDQEAFAMTRLLGRLEGLMCGITSGAALAVAKREAEKPENAGKNLVVLLPDSGDRYLSGDLFDGK